MTRRRIALYAHSTNPRGGVVHTLELGDALARVGHDVTIHAPDATGQGFFRTTAARQVSIKVAPAPASLPAMVARRIEEITAYLQIHAEKFEINHAQDSISANALANLVAAGRIGSFVRTVHHVDTFEDARLTEWQDRGILAAGTCCCVSAVWRDFLVRDYGVTARLVPNGVSRARFSPDPSFRDAILRETLRLGAGPVYLSVGGIEPRKNSLNILRAFERVQAEIPDARLLIAGGASLLDHGAYQAQFDAECAASPAGGQVIRLGTVADQDMPALFRIADALVFPSLAEGFGLVVLEALASETPVVVSRIAPFTEYLTDADAIFAPPQNPGAIAQAMRQALTPQARAAAKAARHRVASGMGWDKSAARQAAIYETLLVPEHADA